MEPAELLAVLILAGAIIILIYYYLIGSGEAARFKTQIYGAGGKLGVEEEGAGYMSGVGEKVSGMGDKIMGKVKDVPISTDIISSKIDAFLEEKSDELIEDWALATKNDINDLQKRLELVARNVDELEHRFNEYRGYTNKKLDSLDERLKKLEEASE